MHCIRKLYCRDKDHHLSTVLTALGFPGQAWTRLLYAQDSAHNAWVEVGGLFCIKNFVYFNVFRILYFTGRHSQRLRQRRVNLMAFFVFAFHMRTAHCTLHTAHCTLHTAHCTLHTAQGSTAWGSLGSTQIGPMAIFCISYFAFKHFICIHQHTQCFNPVVKILILNFSLYFNILYAPASTVNAWGSLGSTRRWQYLDQKLVYYQPLNSLLVSCICLTCYYYALSIFYHMGQ